MNAIIMNDIFLTRHNVYVNCKKWLCHVANVSEMSMSYRQCIEYQKQTQDFGKGNPGNC